MLRSFVVVCALAVFAPTATSQIVVADSQADFAAATNDGIGAGGTPVTPGSPADAAQHGHTDSTDSGSWRYGWGNSGDGRAFGGGFPLFNSWTGSSWVQVSGGQQFGIVSATGQAPLGSSLVANPLAYREWRSDGAFAGQTLTAEFRATNLNEASDGITVGFSIIGIGGETVLITPAMVGQEQVATIDFPDAVGRRVLLSVRPEGTGPPNLSNFFFDSASVRLTITAPIPPCSPIDLAEPFGVISQTDVDAFVSLFFADDPTVAALADPTDLVSQADVSAFVDLFFAGCPSR
ncbi:MAG: hypothetical protein AAFR38_03410 [Planctomycetota bacterium]